MNNDNNSLEDMLNDLNLFNDNPLGGDIPAHDKDKETTPISNDNSEEIDTHDKESHEDNHINNVPKKVELPSLDENSSTNEPKVPIALNKPEMNKVKVTRDGKTLAEILPSLRSGRTSIDKEIDNYATGKNNIKANGKLKSDKRYLKHVKQLERNKAKEESRRKLQSKFVQKNSKYTEDEKIIMNNLKLTPRELKFNLSKESKLSEHDKARMIAMGNTGVSKYFKGKRFRATIGDHDFLEFLAKFKFCNTKIMSRIHGESVSRTWRKLRRLKTNGLVADAEIPGMGTIWFLTDGGMALAGYNFKTYRRRRPRMSVMPPTIGANHVAACLWNNKYNVLSLPDFPGMNKKIITQKGEKWVQGETLVSELEIRSSLNREANPRLGMQTKEAGTSMYELINERAQQVWADWEDSGDKSEGPELGLGDELLWTLFPKGSLTVSYHVPDLVIVRQRDNDGTPHSIAIEVELNTKSRQRYIDTFLAYKLDEHLYEKVIWITQSSRTAQVLQSVAAEVGYTDYDVVPFSNEDGIYKQQDIWFI